MFRIAEFKKISKPIYIEERQKIDKQITREIAEKEYDNIKLPKRATTGSAGYDFFTPCDIKLNPGETKIIPLGICCEMQEGWVLQMYPRSSHGFKYKLQLDDTDGIIDQDYYSDNEGHINIMLKITNDSQKQNKLNTLDVKAGVGICQGIFTLFGITTDDEVDKLRNGRF